MTDAYAAELALLGDLMLAPQLLLPIRGIVQAEDFSSELIRNAFEAACALEDSGQVVDPITLGQELTRRGFPDHTAELSQSLETTATAKHFEAHAQAVRRAGMARRVEILCENAQESLRQGQEPETVLAGIQTQAEQIASSAASTGLQTGSDALRELLEYRGMLEDGGGRAVVPTGFRKLDEALAGGLGVGWLAILGARPSCGKTSLSVAIAEAVAAAGGAVLFTSLEETALSLTARRLGLEAYLMPTRLLQEDALSDDELDRLAAASARLAARPFHLTTELNLTVEKLKFLCRQIQDLRLVIVDYLQLMTATEGRTRYEQVTQLSRSLKLLALDLNVPFLVCAQLNREAEGSEPKLSDLRDSGAIEQDADLVMLLWSPDSSDGRPRLEPGSHHCRVQLIVAKNRHGATGDRFDFGFWPATGVFRL